MDETPEELEQIRREAALIDPNKYKKRLRLMAAIGLGGLAAGLTVLVWDMVHDARNPCERVRAYLCGRDPKSDECTKQTIVVDMSVNDESKAMRGEIRQQCVKKIDYLKADGVVVP